MLDFQGTDPHISAWLNVFEHSGPTVWDSLDGTTVWYGHNTIAHLLVFWLKQAPLNSSALWGVRENSITSQKGGSSVHICFVQFSLLEWMEFVIMLYRTLLF